MTLDEIRTLLRFKDVPQADCGEVDRLLDEHIVPVATRIRDLRQLQKQLKHLREQCPDMRDRLHCGILGKLTQASTPAKTRRVAAGRLRGAHGSRPGRTAPARR